MLENYRAHVAARAALGIPPLPLTAQQTAELVELLTNPPAGEEQTLVDLITHRVPAGVDEAARVKAGFLAAVAKGETACALISRARATELLGTMLGGYNIQPLIELLADAEVGATAAEALKKTLLMFDQFHDVKELADKGNANARAVLQSWADAEWFTSRPEVPESLTITVFKVTGETNTDDLSPAPDATTRPDIPMHALAMLKNARPGITPEEDGKRGPVKFIESLKEKGHLVAYVGDVVGTGSSRKSATNSVLWFTGEDIPFVPNKRFGGVCLGGKIAPIFYNTMEDAGALPIELDVSQMNMGDVVELRPYEGKALKDGKVIAEFQVKSDVLFDEVRAGGRIPLIIGRGLTAKAREALGLAPSTLFRLPHQPANSGKGFSLAQKMVGRACGLPEGQGVRPGTYCEPKMTSVGSQDTTGLMTSQELEMMASTVISPIVDAGYQSGCHTASVWDTKAQENIPRLMKFMNDFGLITARDPEHNYAPMTDVIHKVLNDITVDDWAIIIGGDSHTRMSKGVAFGADSGTVALALATGEASMPIPESVKVTFKGDMPAHMDFRDVVHATQAQMLEEFDGENVFQGRVIEVHIGTLASDQAFTFTDWTAEMKAKASINISDSETLVESLVIARDRIQVMIDKGMDNANAVLQGLVDRANARIVEIESGERPPLAPDADANYYAEFTVDLDQIDEPMIADPDVNNDDPSKRYTHDTIRELSYYGGTKKVDLGFVGSCMVHKGDMKILAQMLRNLEAQHGEVEFQAPLVVAPPTYNIVDELKAEGDWELLSRYAGFEFDDTDPKSVARTGYENILYLERPGCNLCMGNQEKAEPGDTVMATSTRLFQGRVVRDSDEKKGESLLASTPVVVLSSVLGRTPTIEEYKAAVEGIDLTRFEPPTEELTATPVSIGR